MPTYPTPTPIDLAINLPVGRIDVIATDRTDTVVTVSPSTPGRAVDIRGAEETKVAFDGQRLTVKGPKPRFSVIGPSESVDLKVEVPTGSRLTAEISVGGVRATGRLGATRVKNSTGGVVLDTVGDLWLHASHGNATVDAAEGSIEISADHGQIRVGTVSGDAILKSSYGNIQIAQAQGDVDAKLSYGGLEITRALASVAAKTAYGSIQLHEISSGSVEIESGFGEVTIGVLRGIPAWLDLSSKNGRVRNELDGEGTPDSSEQSVVVRARTQGGDITIQRAK